MKGKTHLITALVVLSLFYFFVDFTIYTIYLPILFIVGTLFPDIDEVHSFFGKRVKIIGFLFDHRGFFHSIFSLLTFSYLIYGLVSLQASLYFAAGYLLHLFEDSLTKQGIYPFLMWINLKGPIRVGSLAEIIIYFSFLSLLIVLLTLHLIV